MGAYAEENMSPFKTVLTSVLVMVVVSAFEPAFAAGPMRYGHAPAEYHNDEYFVVNRAKQAPVIDGDLTDACWNESVELFPFSTLGGGGSLSLLQTRVKLTWDDGAFYVAYHCEQPDMELAKRRGDHLEIFFMPLYPDKPYHVNNATAILFFARHKPETRHYQQAGGGMGGGGRLYFLDGSKVESAGKTGNDWWTWEAKIEFKYLWTRGFKPPDPKQVHTWKIGFNRWSNFHGEIGWYGSMLSSLNHQTDHCPVFKLAGTGTAPRVQLTHPMKGNGPGRFSVTIRSLRAGEQTYRVKVLRRNEPFDPVLGEVRPLNVEGEDSGTVQLKHGQDAKLDYQVPFKGWRNQYRVEVWDGGGRTAYYKSLWYSLGDDVLSHGWDSERPQVGILPEPKQILMRKGKFSPSSTTPVLVDAASEADIFSASYLSKPVGSLAQRWPSFAVKEVKSQATVKGRCILIGDVFKSLWMQDVLERRGVNLPRLKLPAQGYVLDISRDLIVVHGEGAAGRFYGVQSIRQLILQNRKALPALRIADWPDLDWRGAWHSFTVNETNIDLACLFKMNVGALSFEKKQKYHFRPFSFNAHTWFGHTGGALVPPEKREPVQGEPVICPASECKDELVAAIERYSKPHGTDASAMPYVFVGADEAPFGTCERCQKMIDERGVGGTVAHHFRDNMYAACKARGKTMMCWADALLAFEDSLNTMPKDFIPLHWMYYATTYSGGLDLLGRHGLPFVTAPMTRGEQSFHFPQIRSRERNIATQARCAAHAKGKGIWTTTWGGGLHDDLLWYPYLLAAEYGWSAGPDIRTFRRKFGRIFFGSENGGDWLLELERLTALYLHEKNTPPATLEEDRKTINQITREISSSIARDWFTKDKLATLLKIAERVREKLEALVSSSQSE